MTFSSLLRGSNAVIRRVSRTRMSGHHVYPYTEYTGWQIQHEIRPRHPSIPLWGVGFWLAGILIGRTLYPDRHATVGWELREMRLKNTLPSLETAPPLPDILYTLPEGQYPLNTQLDHSR